MKNNVLKKAIIFFVLVMALIPVLLFLLVDQCESTVNNIPDYEWLSFWGTYLGACMGILATLITLYYTIKHYMDEQVEREKENEENRREERNRLEERRKFELLMGCQPYLVIENARFSGNAPENFYEIERYAFVEGDELPPRNTKKYTIDFILRNMGNAPLLNLELHYSSVDYCIDGYRDINISKKVKGGPEIVQKFSYDINRDERKRVRVTLDMTEKFLETINSNKYMGRVSFDFVFEDIVGNKICKVITIDTKESTCIGWENQIYQEEEIQKLFCCK